jgi:transposase-like protein
MENIKDAINSARSGDYVEFEKAVHREMNNRIQNDPYIQRRREELSRYKSIASTYSTINSLNKGE